MVEERGTCKFSNADDINIPVDIWLTDYDGETGEKTGYWTLSASNYLPRKGRVDSNAYIAVSPSREELVGVIKRHILPLYETAVKRLNAVCEGKAEELYFWENP